MKIDLKQKNYIELDLIDIKKRDLVLILPGGGYRLTSPREAQPIAHVFKNAGYHTAIYYYRETILMYPEVHQEGYEVLKILSENEQVDRIFLIGFSAGGHLAATLMTNYFGLVQGTILAYPVVTTNPLYKYHDLEDRLLGQNRNQQQIDEISVELHVHERISPVFIIHTMNDLIVPVHNSLLLIEALYKVGVKVESHLYPIGRHGISLATKEVVFDDMDSEDFIEKYGYLSIWIDLALAFLKRIEK